MLAPRDDSGDSVVGRTVLVIEVEWKAHVALLFEIECRRSESGFLMAALVFKAGLHVDRQAVSKRMLREIIDAEGRRLGSAAQNVARSFPGTRGVAFRHRYTKKDDAVLLEPDALRAFLERNEATKAAEDARSVASGASTSNEAALDES
jgi:hypothetical protein